MQSNAVAPAWSSRVEQLVYYSIVSDNFHSSDAFQKFKRPAWSIESNS